MERIFVYTILRTFWLLLIPPLFIYLTVITLLTFPDAVQLATGNPARYLGVADEYGQIAQDAVADLVVWNKYDLQIKHVFLAGEQVTDSSQPAFS